MGDGYNEMANDSIRKSEGMMPPLSGDLLATLDSDNIVGSLESEYGEKYPSPCDLYEAIANGEVAATQNSPLEDIIPYTDADKSCSVLKCEGAVEPYFQEAYDSYLLEHGELPEIGSFFSEPSEEDLAAFSREEASSEDVYVMVSGDRLEDIEGEHEAAAPEVADHAEGAEGRETNGYDVGEDFEDR